MKAYYKKNMYTYKVSDKCATDKYELGNAECAAREKGWEMLFYNIVSLLLYLNLSDVNY